MADHDELIVAGLVIATLGIGGLFLLLRRPAAQATPGVPMALEVPTPSGSWTNEETVEIRRNAQGFIEEYRIHRVVEGT